MKTVEFHGKTYQVPDGAKYIAYNYCGEVYCFGCDVYPSDSEWESIMSVCAQFESIKLDKRYDLDKSLWHGSLTEI